MTMNVNSREVPVYNKKPLQVKHQGPCSECFCLTFDVLLMFLCSFFPHSFLLSYNLEFLPSVFFFVFLLLSTPLFLHSFFASFFHNFFFVHPPMTNLPVFSPSFLCSTIQPTPLYFRFCILFSSISLFNISAECKCPPYAQCQRDENNFKKYKCVCPSPSSEEQNKVCGSDGRTYINRRVLERDSCVTDIKITILYAGVCSKLLPVKILIYVIPILP